MFNIFFNLPNWLPLFASIRNKMQKSQSFSLKILFCKRSTKSLPISMLIELWKRFKRNILVIKWYNIVGVFILSKSKVGLIYVFFRFLRGFSISFKWRKNMFKNVTSFLDHNKMLLLWFDLLANHKQRKEKELNFRFSV